MPAQNKPRIGKLDSVRGVAAVMVLVGHCGGLPFNLSASGLFFWIGIFWDGSDAVVMFFLLSGYVLALQLDNPSRPTSVGFLIRRVMRIWPAFAVTLVFAYVILSGLGIPAGSGTAEHAASRVPTFGDLQQNLLMIGNSFAIDGPAWSLYVEMRLSIVFPLLFLFARRLNIFYAILISVALSVLGSRLVHWNMPEFLISLADASRFICLFVVGALLIRPDNVIASVYRRMSHWARAAGFIFAVFCLVYRFIPIAMPAQNYVPWIGVTMIFIYCLYSEVADRLLTQGSLLFMGRISYGLYLVHYPILQVVNAYIPKRFSLLLVLPLSILIGWIINVWIEQPMIRIGRKLSPPSTTSLARTESLAAR
jgi:peptidoglycan/LPS O-acetylase OafA/YrhL